MRVNKFRAWDDTLHKMLPARTLEDIAKSDFCACNWYQLHLMQYIGINDYRGVEIYESDIIRIVYEDAVGVHEEIRKVYYVKDKCGYFPFMWEGDCDYCDGWTTIIEVEVIGNIYENQELLKEI